MENKVYFFNTLTRKVEQFIPNVDGKVAMYTGNIKEKLAERAI